MPAKTLFILISWILSGTSWRSSAQAAPSQETIELCEHITLVGKLETKLHDLEKRLVCGEPANSSNEAWQTIPLHQSLMSLRSFLKDRGYYSPKVVKTPKGASVEIGEQTLVRKIQVENAPDDLHIETNREIVGQVLTPKLLRKIDKWVYVRLQTLGYACPRVKSEADPETGLVLTHVERGLNGILVGVERSSTIGLRPSALERHEAFKLNEPYDGRLVSITENRILSEGIVQSLHLAPHCDGDRVTLTQEALTGRPRLIRVGFGASTESLYLIKGSWRNTRLDDSASWVTVGGKISSIEQNASGTLSLYPWQDTPRTSLRTSILASHIKRKHYETQGAQIQFGPHWTWDNRDLAFSTLLAPEFDYFHLIEGLGPSDSHFLSLNWTLAAKSHQFEYDARNPRSGYEMSFHALLNNQAVESSSTAQKLMFDWKQLWNYKDYDAPLWIFGYRLGVATTITDQVSNPDIRLPPAFLSYLGGARNIRGFALEELPTSQVGGLTDYFTGIELRLSSMAYEFNIKYFPQRIEPFLFIDAGGLGMKSLELDPTIYWSPGFGLRWASTIGPIRFTLARGFPNSTPGHLQFYFSLGEEF